MAGRWRWGRAGARIRSRSGQSMLLDSDAGQKVEEGITDPAARPSPRLPHMTVGISSSPGPASARHFTQVSPAQGLALSLIRPILSLPRRPPCPSPSSTTSPSLSRRPPTTRSSRSRSLDRSGLASLVSAPAPVADRSVDGCIRLAKLPTAIVSMRLLSWLRQPHERVSRSPISPRDS